jgi:coatomer subunit beta
MEKSCTMLIHFDKPQAANEIKEALETGDGPTKCNALKSAIMMLLNGEQLPALFITIVRYVLPSDDNFVQKLLLLYLEIIEKTDSTGKVLPEMILICQNLRNNLQHPNEYIRGSTLRFLCRLQETELLEPLIPSVMSNLEHRHSFVRRNAVLAVMNIYRLPGGDTLMPDAPEFLEKMFTTESDISTRRNVFLMLFNCAQDRAVEVLLNNLDQVGNWGDILQMVVLELVRKVCRTSPEQKGKYMKIILQLLQTNNTAVVYECAGALVSLSSAPTAIRAASNCYCQLLQSQSDNNVKLIVLDRLLELKTNHREVMQDMVMDVVRALASPNMDIRRKTLDIALDLITPRNIDEVVLTLKKEVVKTQNKELEKNGEYRQMLVQAIHTCAVKFPDVAGSVVHLLMDFLGDSNTASALDVIFFVREIIETNEKLRESILQRLLDCFYQIRSSRVCACALWIIGEYSNDLPTIESSLAVLKASLGSVPFYAIESEDSTPAETAGGEREEGRTNSKRPAVLSDGTYATQVSVVENSLPGGNGVPNLRAVLLTGDFFLGSVVATTLTKLALRMCDVATSSPARLNAVHGEVMLYIVSMLRLGESPVLAHPIDDDSADRLQLCLNVLLKKDDAQLRKVWLRECRSSYATMIAEKLSREESESKSSSAVTVAQADDLIDFYHLKNRKGMTQLELEDEVATDMKRATGSLTSAADNERKLNRMLQLTGFSDPVYAEAYVTVHQYDIVLDVTVMNRTKDTLQNLCLELATMGDLKLVERPQNYTLSPGETKQIRANIKVSSTETGVIFGNIVYDATGASDRSVVVLNDIHIDIMDYISPASTADVAFRNMWAEFEWENKVAVNTSITDVQAFLDHIVASTNMKCLTPLSALEGDCGFLAANLYAKSVFGEDALVNVSIEKQPVDNKLTGYIRIRSKTQGIALSLGDKITLKQKGRN